MHPTLENLAIIVIQNGMNMSELTFLPPGRKNFYFYPLPKFCLTSLLILVENIILGISHQLSSSTSS